MVADCDIALMPDTEIVADSSRAVEPLRPGSLLVFSDDWGRHPSSCQHLMRHLLTRYPVTWVNTIGMRTPKLNRATVSRVIEKLKHWTRTQEDDVVLPRGLQAISPQMWPWFTRSFDRRINRRTLSRGLRDAIAKMPQPVVAVSTIPVTADLIGELDVARWLYYCVDDFSVWPGLDGDTMKQMDLDQISRVDELIAVSRTLQDYIAGQGRQSTLLTHGIDLAHWKSGDGERENSVDEFAQAEPVAHEWNAGGPRIVFWGVVDRRMDSSFVLRLADATSDGMIDLIGPADNPDPALAAHPRITLKPPVSYDAIPGIAAAADVLVMPYIDAAVTRAMQPLKLKEYLATGKAVVVRRLPSTESWADCLDVVETADEFAAAVLKRIEIGIDDAQVAARERLVDETWAAKSEAFDVVLSDVLRGPDRQSGDRPEGRANETLAQIDPVLHVRVITGTGGGPDKTILNSPRFLRGTRYPAYCAFLHPPGDAGFDEIKARGEAAGAPVISVPDSGAVDFGAVRELVRICREKEIRIWHGHDYKSNVIGLIVRRFHPMKLVSTVHGWGNRSAKLDRYFAVDRWALKRYERVLCVSENLLDVCIQSGVPVGNCELLRNGIVLDDYAAGDDRETVRRELDLPAGIPLIGAVGRLADEKGFDRLIRAVCQVREAGVDVALVIAGEGPERERLTSLIDELGCGDRVRLLGHLADPRIVYRAIDAYALSSLREGLPNVVLEAMASSVPVVATRIAAIPTLVKDGINGLIVEPDDVEGLAAALILLSSNAALRADIGAAGRRTVVGQFSFTARMQRMVSVYDDVTGRDSAGNRDVVDATANANGLAELVCSPRGWNEFLVGRRYSGFHQSPEWLEVLHGGLDHTPLYLQTRSGGRITGVLPLALVESRLFGKHLVSLPYLNTGGVVADFPEAEQRLVELAMQLADSLGVKNLELRHEREVEHPALTCTVTSKVHMRLALPESTEAMWNGLKSKVRSQIRKPLNDERMTVEWGRHELLDDFYDIFVINMRDLGTPSFSRRLFESILHVFSERSEICVIRFEGRAVAAGLLVHGPGTTEVPSASSLREFNSTSANMLMYWHLVSRAIERGQECFDFGRSSRDSGTYRFKKQWGAKAVPAVWQHYVRQGSADDMQPTNSKFELMIRVWRKLPVWLTRLIGPAIVRGIP